MNAVMLLICRISMILKFRQFRIDVPEYVKIEEVDVEYVVPYIHEPDAEEFVEIVSGVEGQE